jgi:hypothetical protein
MAQETLRNHKLIFWPAVLIFLMQLTGLSEAFSAPIEKLSFTSRIPTRLIWLGPDLKPLPFKDYSEMEEFLLEAKILSRKTIPTGVTRPEKLLLENEGIRMHAIFRTVDIFKQQWKSKEGLKMNFRDHYRFETAAYELGKLLGLKNIPPVVQRTIDGDRGSIQAWVEGSFTERVRMERRLAPPNSIEWIQQLHLVRVFDNLISNDDRNQGNILIDQNWHIWMIDATRAFRIDEDLIKPESIRYCPRILWENLITVEEEDLRKILKDSGLLSPEEFRTLLVRRRKLIEHIKRLIEARGEEVVLFDQPALFSEP